MPLTAEQTAAITTIAGADADEVAEALKSSAQPIYQKIFRGGHSTATNAAKAEKQTLEQQLATEKERATTLQTELEELKAKAPDRAAIDQQWQTKLTAREKELQAQIDAANGKVAKLTTETTAEKIENALVSAGLRPRIAKLLAKEHAGRIEYDDTGKPVLHEPGTKIPVQIPDGKTAFDVLAEAEKKSADPADLASNVDTGGGTSGGGGGSTGISPQKIEEQKRASGAYVL